MATICFQKYVSERRSSNGDKGPAWAVSHKNHNRKILFKQYL